MIAIPSIWLYTLVTFVARIQYVQGLLQVDCGVESSVLSDDSEQCTSTIYYIDSRTGQNLTYVNRYGNSATSARQLYTDDIAAYCDSLYPGLRGQCWLVTSTSPVTTTNSDGTTSSSSNNNNNNCGGMRRRCPSSGSSASSSPTTTQTATAGTLLLEKPTATAEGVSLGITTVVLFVALGLLVKYRRFICTGGAYDVSNIEAQQAAQLAALEHGTSHVRGTVTPRCKGLWSDASDVAVRRLKPFVEKELIPADDILSVEPYVLLGVPAVIVLDALSAPTAILPHSMSHSSASPNTDDEASRADMGPQTARDLAAAEEANPIVLVLSEQCLVMRSDLPAGQLGINIAATIVELRELLSTTSITRKERAWLVDTLLLAGRPDAPKPVDVNEVVLTGATTPRKAARKQRRARRAAVSAATSEGETSPGGTDTNSGRDAEEENEDEDSQPLSRADVLQKIAGLLQKVSLDVSRLEGFHRAFRRAARRSAPQPPSSTSD